MFSRILIATDLTPASQEVVNCARGLKALGTKEVILTHCINIRHDVGGIAKRIEELIKPDIMNQKRLLEEQGFATTVEIVLGLPHIEINRLAKERKCSAIIIGSIGSSTWGEVMLGGVANAILHYASMPVFVVRVKAYEKDGQVTCEVSQSNFTEHILFPTDFSDNAEYAFTYVEKFVESGTKRVTLLHVQEKARIEKYLEHRLDEFNEIDRNRLERLKTELEKKGATDVRIELPYGSPVKEILKQISETGVSLVIMGSQGRGFISEVLLGSVSYNISRSAPVSVFLVPKPR